MSEKQPLISICIPTYNRAEYLKATIKSIVTQPEFASGTVEVVVSDNASTDDTFEVCREYSDYPNFHYYRNPCNIHDRNFPLVLSKASGILRKLNNDTFIHKDDSLKILCELVNKYQKTRPFIFLRNIGGEDEILNFKDFVFKLGFWVTWIAGFTIWDFECYEIDKDIDGCNLQLWQMRKAYALAYQKNNTVICNKIIGESISLQKKDVSYGLYNVFYNNYLAIIGTYIESGTISARDVEYLKKQLLFEFFADWIVQYDLNNTKFKYSKSENLHDAVFNQYKGEPYWNEFVKIYKRKLARAKLKIIIKKLKT